VLLALDTSAERGSVALFDGDTLLGEVELEPGERHAASLLVCLEALFARTGKTLDAVDRIALSIGPGSFTGLRIGLASALGLAFGTQRKLVPVPTLAALALQAESEGLVAPILDARRGEVYAGVYHAHGREVVADCCAPIEVFLERVPTSGPLTLLGSGVAQHRAALEARLGARARYLPEAAGVLRARSVGRLALRLAAEGLLVAPERVELRYLRAAEAEAKRSALHQKGEPIP
jgi:tRNA threonylcarbamoyladenosine biosynthesis protein TsaB